MSKTRKSNALKTLEGYRVLPSVTDESIESILEGLNCPRSLAVCLLYRYGEHAQLVDLDFDAGHYASPHDARCAYLATELLSKADFLEIGVDRREVALSKFYSAEKVCKETNQRFRDLASDQQFAGQNVWLLNATTRKIASLLDGGNGSVDSFCPLEWFDSCMWGPGASTRISGRDTSSTYKFLREVGITRDLYCLVGPLLPVAYPLWGKHLHDVSEDWGLLYEYSPKISFEVGNKVLTVPKNAKTDRVIAAEPGLNCWFQLGLGTMISRRLLRNGGFDLKTQDRNGLLAFYASMSGQLATVDFSSASDTICTEVVRNLLPARWFSVLDSCRSKYGQVDGEMICYEKFSSMGNGFTFPLQSLIFAGAALAVCEFLHIDDSYVGVFGDDVVIPSKAFDLYRKFVSFLGFSVNPEKSFSDGFFRESCGTHYLRGVDLKPFYIRRRLKGIADVYLLANNIRRWSSRNMYYGCDPSLYVAWANLIHQVPKNLRFFVPEGIGDGGFVGDFDEASPKTYRKASDTKPLASPWVEGYSVRCLQFISIKRTRSHVGLLLARLCDLGISLSGGESRALSELSGSGNDVPFRRLYRTVISTVQIQRWCNIGPWLLESRVSSGC